MKIKKKKLSLNKLTVAHLDNSLMSGARGGVDTDSCTYQSVLTCPETNCGKICDDSADCPPLITVWDCSDPCTKEWTICLGGC